MDVGDLTNGVGYPGSGSITGPPGIGITSTTSGWWNSTSTITATPANTDVMNQLCRVCGEPAAGFHFGAFTCEGCKSFFGRTYNNLGSISECKNGGVCVINKKNRTACKACRLRKCLMVGMSKSGSRYGRRSNWFKIHCLLQEQSHQAQTRLKDPKTSLYEKPPYSPLDAANNNNNNNNGASQLNIVPISTYDNNRIPKREDARSQELTPTQRPETSRFPMTWRGPPFFHPALTHMQLLNAPFFPFQQRFIVPYVNQVNAGSCDTGTGSISTPQMITSLSSSSSESISPRSTPSLKDKDDSSNHDNQEFNVDNKKSEVSSYDKSLAFLKSLGPEQDEPIDLSMKSHKSGKSLLVEIDESLTDADVNSTDSETEVTENHEDVAPPLDLTRKT